MSTKSRTKLGVIILVALAVVTVVAVSVYLGRQGERYDDYVYSEAAHAAAAASLEASESAADSPTVVSTDPYRAAALREITAANEAAAKAANNQERGR